MTDKELSESESNLVDLFTQTPLPDDELMDNLGLYIDRQSLTRILFMYDLYSKAVNIHGDVMEFGTRWGQNMVLFSNFRGMLEPYNHNRKIVGFDTFDGFPTSSISERDDSVDSVSFETVEDYESYLNQLLAIHEEKSPIPEITKYEVVAGDVEKTLEEYLSDNPQTIIALAYFDLDLYQPTKTSLELIKDRLPKGAVLGFDELNAESWPGETEALKEVFGLDEFKIERSSRGSMPSYVVKR